MKILPQLLSPLLFSLALVSSSCGRSPRIADQGKADQIAVDRLIEAATGAKPQGKVVLVLPASVEYQGVASEQMSGRFRAKWKDSAAPLVDFRLARSTDSSIRENPAEFRRFAVTVGTLTAEDVAALKAAHPDARLYVSFCGLPASWNADPGGPKWVAYCPAGAKGGVELARAGALIAVVQPRQTPPPGDASDFDTFYSFDTPATLSAPATP